MDHLNLIENQFMTADQLISENKISEAKTLLEELLEQAPDYGRAHNHLGWIYATKLSNFEKGLQHYELAMKFDPNYTASYINYTYALIDTGRYEDAKKHINSVLETKTNINKSSYYCELGIIYEYEKDFTKAYHFYKEAYDASLNQSFMDQMQVNMKRIKAKLPFLKRIFL